MTSLLLLRHGPTPWNEEKRLQGRRDLPLSLAGREEVARWRLPEGVAGYRWMVSPLRRARETAALLGLPEPALEPALIEMDWGAWEGERLADLRRILGAGMEREEARGLDMTPPGGESPRDLQERLKPLLRRIGEENRPTGWLCHRGVIRALYAFASGWDLTGAPPVKLRNACLQRFEVSSSGEVAVAELNIPLLPEGGAAR